MGRNNLTQPFITFKNKHKLQREANRATKKIKIRYIAVFYYLKAIFIFVIKEEEKNDSVARQQEICDFYLIYNWNK